MEKIQNRAIWIIEQDLLSRPWHLQFDHLQQVRMADHPYLQFGLFAAGEMLTAITSVNLY